MGLMLDSDFVEFVATLVVVVAIVGAVLLLVTVGSGVVFTGIHWRLRLARERKQGLNSEAVLGSRAGSWLGLCAGLGLWLISVSVSRFIPSTLPFADLLLYLSGIPIATWGMLAGSIAGNRTNARSAGRLGAVLFLLVANPAAWLWTVADIVMSPEQQIPYILLLAGAVKLVLAVVIGAVTGVLAVRAGRRGAAVATAD